MKESVEKCANLRKEELKGTCKFCGKECKNQNSLRNHERLCRQNPDKQTSNLIKYLKDPSAVRSNQYIKAKELGLPKPEMSEETKRKIGQAHKGKKLSEAHKKLLSEKAKKLEYYKHKYKRGRYSGIWCDSSWELAYVVYNLEHGIAFERNRESFEYMYKGELHKYKPDFIENGVYVELKGYVTDQVLAKEAAFTKPYKRLSETDMRIYLDYTIEKYGKKFWERLYENKI